MKYILFFVVLAVCLQNSTSKATPLKNKLRSPLFGPLAHYDPHKGTAYYVDFTAETYTPTTPESIKHGSDKIILTSDSWLSIQSILRRRLKTKINDFDGQKVRLRVQDDRKKSFVIVDQQGTVFDNGKEYSLTPFAFVQLDDFIHFLNKSKYR